MKPKVLLVGEEMKLLEPISESLEEAGCSVIMATTAERALDLVQRHEFDVVVLDLLMGGADAVSMLRQIKNLMPLTEVIFLADGATVEAAAKGIRLGAFDYVLISQAHHELPHKIRQAKARKTQQEQKIKLVENDFGRP